MFKPFQRGVKDFYIYRVTSRVLGERRGSLGEDLGVPVPVPLVRREGEEEERVG